MNKNLMWVCYYAEEKPTFKTRRLARGADWLSRQYWIDLILDLATLALFTFGTGRAFVILSTATP